MKEHLFLSVDWYLQLQILRWTLIWNVFHFTFTLLLGILYILYRTRVTSHVENKQDCFWQLGTVTEEKHVKDHL